MAEGLRRRRAGGHVPPVATPVATQAHVPAGATNPSGTSYVSPSLTAQDPPPTNFLDSLYGLSASQLLDAVAKQRGALAAQQETEGQNHQHALQQLAQARAKTLEGTRDQANTQGLFYSGQLGKRYNDVNSAYDERQFQENARDKSTLGNIANQLAAIGEIRADPSSPLGYTATGGAANSLYGYLSDAAARRVNALGSDPVATQGAAATPQAPAASSPLAGLAKKRAPRMTVYGRPLHPY